MAVTKSRPVMNGQNRDARVVARRAVRVFLKHCLVVVEDFQDGLQVDVFFASRTRVRRETSPNSTLKVANVNVAGLACQWDTP
jgi:hypothetical protein